MKNHRKYTECIENKATKYQQAHAKNCRFPFILFQIVKPSLF